MTFPNTKDIFRRVANYVSGTVEAENKLDENDQNNMADTVEGIQDSLGLNPEGSSADVAERLEDIDGVSGSLSEKVDKAGDTMTGKLIMSDTQIDIIDDTGAGVELDAENPGYGYDTLKLKNKETNNGVELRLQPDNNASGVNLQLIGTDNSGTAPILEITVTGSGITLNKYNTPAILINSQVDVIGSIGASIAIENYTAGSGFVCKTPDGTKRYEITVDNSGNLITTLLT